MLCVAKKSLTFNIEHSLHMQHFTDSSTEEIHALLHDIWGYQEFRYPQLDIIQYILGKESCLAVMPTGSGKSLCYQILSLLSTQLVLVVSPLIALMEDQVHQSNVVGISAASLHSSMTQIDKNQIHQRIRARQLKLLFVSPERLQVPSFLSMIKDVGISLLVVDEAHCISQWGHDFRPAYTLINASIKTLGHPKVLALTATAPRAVQSDIRRQLNIRKRSVFRATLFRDNLAIRFMYSVDKRAFLCDHLNTDESTIIYIQNRKRAERIAAYLTAKTYPAVAYHAGMSKENRAHHQELWMTGTIPCIVATNAFGMGINKSNVRTVYHYALPNSIEDYYQEIGRAGRDGRPANCIILYNNKDLALSKKRLAKLSSISTSAHIRSKKRSAHRMLGLLSRNMCRFKYVLDYFDEDLPSDCGCCDYCVEQKNLHNKSIDPLKIVHSKQSLLTDLMETISTDQHEELLQKLNNLIDEGNLKLKDAYLELTKLVKHQA